MPWDKAKYAAWKREYRKKRMEDPAYRERMNAEKRAARADPVRGARIRENERRSKSTEQARQRQRESLKRRKVADPAFRLRVNLRVRLCMAIRNQVRKSSKNPRFRAVSAVGDLGCSIPDLMAYLESKFRPGMTWENWGHGADKWNIDHIRPLASFDLTQPDQQKAACHYTNLQPLWHAENLRKRWEDQHLLNSGS